MISSAFLEQDRVSRLVCFTISDKMEESDIRSLVGGEAIGIGLEKTKG